MPVAPFKVKAVYDYKSAEPDDLNFPNGQVITVTEEEDDDWYSGQYVDGAGQKREGIFPKNFVEKYEPEVPLRPTRPARAKREPDVVAAVAPIPIEEPRAAERVDEPVREAEITPDFHYKDTSRDAAETFPSPATAQASVQRSAAPAAPKPSAQGTKITSGKPPPPQVAEKPDVGSFKDRMAMFNKAAAPPVAPFKPGGQGGGGSSGFIRKPFVAPPPSKNAYVPPPRDPPPPKVYRREEDPSMLVEQADEPMQSTTLPVEPEATVDDDQPKPTSLKDRIALLQKQQMEQARRAEGVVKKEKPKKPAKKHIETDDSIEPSDLAPRPSMERVASGDTIGKKSVDFADDESGPLRGHVNRQTSAALATPPQPSRELVSDTNDADDSGAGDTEEAQEISTEEERPNPRLVPVGSPPLSQSHADAQTLEQEPNTEEADDGADEDEDVDPEVRRRMEIRERMAKMSGGMGMMGMFGGGMPSAGAAKKPKVSGDNDRNISTAYEPDEATARAPPVPIMALPGMSITKNLEAEMEDQLESDTEEPPSRTTPRNAMTPITPRQESDFPTAPHRSSTDRPAPPVPPERAVPPPPPPTRSSTIPEPHHSFDTRSSIPPQRRMERALSPGEDSDDERSLQDSRPPSKESPPTVFAAPPVPSGRPTNMTVDTASPMSPTASDRRASRVPPSIPISSPIFASPQTRAPPPPPPGQPPTRRSNSDSHNLIATKHHIEDDSEDEVTEYDGDYDTDIASSAKHKDALKSHARDSSLDESTLTDDASIKQPPTSPPTRPVPPLPQANAPRDIPPPPPQHAMKPSRQSTDVPRAAPPPVPPPKQPLDEEDYDPYRYAAPERGVVSPPPMRPAPPPTLQSPAEEVEADDLYDATPIASRAVPPPPLLERSVPPPPPSLAPLQPSLAPPSQTLGINRTKSQSRRSMEQSRPTGDQGFIAQDIDMAQTSFWWAQENVPPPALQGRNDIFYEMESSTSAKSDGKSTVSKDVYVLYMDYSMSIVSAVFDAAEPHNVIFEQRHERPPPALRQDQLENASLQYGARIAEAAHAKQNSTVGDGSPHALVVDVIKPLAARGVLAPIGTRSYGALVYANLANASTQQFDEIRPGDIATFRNAKFAGHKGTMHAKYASEAGKPGQDHVGVVLDWDGTKKKIRVWEQGRFDKDGKKAGSSKVKEESWKVGDLKSGEVRVWRVMGRSWVGWDSKS